MAKPKRLRIPKLRFTRLRNIGWYVVYRDRATSLPTKHRFGIEEKEREREARILYHAWVSKHLGGKNQLSHTEKAPTKRKAGVSSALSGSLIEIVSGLIASERARIRKDGEPRRRGTIDPRVFTDRRKQIRDFLAFLNERHAMR